MQDLVADHRGFTIVLTIISIEKVRVSMKQQLPINKYDIDKFNQNAEYILSTADRRSRVREKLSSFNNNMSVGQPSNLHLRHI